MIDYLSDCSCKGPVDVTAELTAAKWGGDTLAPQSSKLTTTKQSSAKTESALETDRSTIA